MILRCSKGHTIDTERITLSGSMYKNPGDKCGELISYDIMSGSKYCQRRLILIEFVKIKMTNTIKHPFWAKRLRRGVFLKVNKFGEWEKYHIIICEPNDIEYEKFAQFNKKYGNLELIK